MAEKIARRTVGWTRNSFVGHESIGLLAESWRTAEDAIAQRQTPRRDKRPVHGRRLHVPGDQVLCRSIKP